MTGATQQSDALFRSMQPFVDPGWFCSFRLLPPTPLNPCCVDPLSCLAPLCCNYTSNLSMSLACCGDQTTCQAGSECSVQSGNIRSATNIASFSSLGPTADGRIKPDLVVPGEDTLSAATPSQTTPGAFAYTSPNHCVIPSQSVPRQADDARNNALRTLSGTSMAAPLLAGGAEKIRQYFLQGYYPLGSPASGVSFNPDAALVRAVILASCDPLAGTGGVWKSPTRPVLPYVSGFYRLSIPSAFSPNFFEGFGAPALDHAVPLADSATGYNMVYQNATFTPASPASAFTVTCDANSDVRVSVALVWTDPAGSVSGRKQLVNDLDLIVLADAMQFFGNMRPFADQLNTVERVMLPVCPASGSFTAIVASGAPILTVSQTWYLVANGPVTDMSPTTTPPYARGRQDPPLMQSGSCLFLPGIVVRLQFVRSAAWQCAWNCSAEIAMFQATVAQVVGIGGQGVRVVSFNQQEVTMILRCTSAITAWQSGGISLKYVTPSSILNAIQYICQNVTTTCLNDPSLAAFNWTTLAPIIPPDAQTIVSVTTYSNSNCTNASNPFLEAPNPITFTDATCTPGPILPQPDGRQMYLKAVSCRNGNATFAVHMNDPVCAGTGVNASFAIGVCTFDSLFFVSVNCSNVSPLPPPPSPNADPTIVWSAK